MKAKLTFAVEPLPNNGNLLFKTIGNKDSAWAKSSNAFAEATALFLLKA